MGADTDEVNGAATFERVLVITAPSQKDLLESLSLGVSNVGTGSYRLIILNPSLERIEKAKNIILSGKEARGMQGIWFVKDGIIKRGGKVAFGFPGVDSTTRVDVQAVAKYFGFELPNLNENVTLESRGTEVFYISDLYMKVLRKIGIKADAMFGHSLGEWSGLVASGLTPENTVDEVLNKLKPGMLPVPGVVFAALGCGVEKAQHSIVGLPDVQISHDNCPHQSIICGIESSIDAAIAKLTAAKVMCQKLNFRSGFHTELFRPFLGPLQQSIETMVFSKPKTTLWSATTCRPYPTNETEIRKLSIQHLVEPVRFRELTLAMYSEGYRVFAQIGSGSLPGFINDTLRGVEHLALSTVVPTKPALGQFQRFCLSLFAEGLDFDIKFLTGTPKEVSLNSSLLEELKNSFELIQNATAEIVTAFAKQSLVKFESKSTLTNLPFRKTITKHLSVLGRPELMDHTFYKQRVGWTNVNDLFPVMPLTGSIDLVIEMAKELFPHLKVVAVENVKATKWIAVDTPTDFTFEVSFDGNDRIDFNLPGHFAATVVMASEYAKSPDSQQQNLKNPRDSRVIAQNIYKDGWLFHGPKFQCIKHLGPIGENGLDGLLEANNVPGALLDNAGQLAGYLIMESVEEDRYAMPIRIKKLEFFSDLPTSGEVQCNVRFDRIRARDIMLNMELSQTGKMWARIEGWEKWRFETDDDLWNFLLKPGTKLLSKFQNGYAWFERRDINGPAAEDLARRYLRQEERDIFYFMGNKKEAWICGRVAAKDAVRNYLWNNGYKGNIFPAEILIVNDSLGRPLVKEHPGDVSLFISISHTKGLGLACVSQTQNIGIDVEKIEPRENTFLKIAFSAEEIKLLPTADQSEWITRWWGAKEAYSKSKGTGLKGDPKAFKITELKNERIKVEDQWITTHRIGEYIISHTET